MFLIISIAVTFVALLIGMMIGYSMGEGRKRKIDFEMYKVSKQDIELLIGITTKIQDDVNFEFYDDMKKMIDRYSKIVKRVYEKY